MTTQPSAQPEELFFETAAQWEAWLAEHYGFQPGVQLKMAKKGSGVPSVNRTEALDVALCYGWIDGQANSVDDVYYLQKYTPRRPRSIWSQINISKVAALIAAGRMQEPGYAAIAAAKADGRWDAAYASPRHMVVAPDFAAALDENPHAKAFFETLNKTNRYAVLWRIETAKKPETRRSRIEKLIAMLNDGQKLH